MIEQFDKKPDQSPSNEPSQFAAARLERTPVQLGTREAIDWLKLGMARPDQLLIQSPAADNSNKAEAPKENPFFTEPFNKEKAAELIKALGEPDFQTREAAQQKLERMGPAVLEQLRAALKSEDREVRRGAQEAIGTIEQETNRFCLKVAEQLVPDYEKLLKKAGFDMANQLSITRGVPTVRVGPFMKIGDRLEVPNEKEQKVFDQLIKDADVSPAGTPEYKTLLDQARERAFRNGATEQEKNDYCNLTWLDFLKDEGRLRYAEALGGSKRPSDQEKGERLLIDYMERHDYAPGSDVMAAAIRLGVTEKKEFREVFVKKGGSIDRLEKLKKTMKNPEEE